VPLTSVIASYLRVVLRLNRELRERAVQSPGANATTAPAE